jgi:DNA-binding MarR family transcriptional regulator
MLFSGAKTPPEPMGHLTGFLLNLVATRSREAFAGGLAELGLRPQQFAVLTMIEASPGMAQQDLVAATGIDPSSMVAMLDALEHAGLAERHPHPDDRRKRALHLTAEGTERLAQARRVAAADRPTVFGARDDDEFAELHRMLRKLAGYAD